MSTPAKTSTRGEFQNSLLGEIIKEQTTSTNVSHSNLDVKSSISPVPSTRDEFCNSLLGEANNASTTFNSYHQNSKAESKISTCGESFDSLLGESNNVSRTTTKSHKQDSNSASISTRGESFDSLLWESLNNEASTATNPSQPKLKKCEFIKPTVNFLGHVISFGQVERGQHLVEAIATAELPKTMRQLNAVGLQYEGEIEIVEFHNMIGSEAQEENPDEDPVELNSLEFFIKALSYFEGEANGQLSSSEQSPASLVRSETQRCNINAIKTALLAERKQCGSSQILNDPINTREESSHSLLGEKEVERSISNLNFCAMEVKNIVGINSKLTSEYQMSDGNLRWLKEVIQQRETNNDRPKTKRKGLIPTQKKLLKYLPSFIILKDLIYFVDEDKFGNERHRYVMPKNETNLTMQELHCIETAGHLGTDKTIEKIKSRFFWINLSKDVKKFIKCFNCQKVKTP